MKKSDSTWNAKTEGNLAAWMSSAEAQRQAAIAFGSRERARRVPRPTAILRSGISTVRSDHRSGSRIAHRLG